MPLDFSKEDNLLTALKEGNLSAFEYLYKHYKYWMLLEAYSILKNDLAAQDLVQDLMIDFWHKKLYNNITANIKGYLLITVRNRAYNYMRDARRKENKKMIFLNIQLGLADFEQEGSDIKSSLENAIARLPPKTHAVFTQFYLEGLSQKKIGELMNISPNTVNNLIENARKQIRKLLKKI